MAELDAYLLGAAEAAAATVGRLTRPSGPRAGEGWCGFEPRERVADGGRNSYLASAAGWLLPRMCSLSDLEAALLAHNRNVCSPPLGENEVRKVAASIWRYR